MITRQSWETERKKYNLVVSEVVEVECGRGDAESASRRRELLGEVSLFPLNERILELVRVLVVPERDPVNFYLPGTSGISRTFVFAGKWRGFLRTMATPKRPSVRRKAYLSRNRGRRSAPRGLRGAGLLRGGARL